ncbi:barstar family protein [Actinomadura sp. 21ATH]|uniref:barstar family protein n=1 Tax=Actinomadura sp. 21ATH TaxID=1735444 RepID=UPI0035C0C662
MDASGAIDEMIEGRVEPGVYQWRAPTAPGAGVAATGWAEKAEKAGWRAFHLDGHRARDRESFLRLSAGVFDLPDWFGGNWDALEDCLRDLSWAPADRGYLVVYEAWAELAEADQGAFRTALGVLTGAVRHWRDTGTPMTVLLSSMGVEVAGVPRLA